MTGRADLYGFFFGEEWGEYGATRLPVMHNARGMEIRLIPATMKYDLPSFGPDPGPFELEAVEGVSVTEGSGRSTVNDKRVRI